MKININLGFVTLILVALKLSGYLNWPWLWVFAPLIITAAAVIAVIGFAVLIMGIALLLGIPLKITDKRKD